MNGKEVESLKNKIIEDIEVTIVCILEGKSQRRMTRMVILNVEFLMNILKIVIYTMIGLVLTH